MSLRLGGASWWSALDGEPALLTELAKRLGASGLQAEELWALEDDALEGLKPVHGLVFLSRWAQDDEPAGNLVRDARLDKIFFAKQVLPDACATLALLTLLMNCKHPDLTLDADLTDFKKFTAPLDPKLRGLALINSQKMRKIHNSMERITVDIKDNRAQHFVAYLPIDGRIYELDGLKDGPVDLGSVAPDQDWVYLIRPALQKRIDTYKEGKIHFNLMALVSDRKMIYEQRISELIEQAEFSQMETDDIYNEIAQYRMLIEYEDTKMARYHNEMKRRRHDYTPFLMEMLKILSEKGQLMSAYKDARRRADGRPPAPKKLKL